MLATQIEVSDGTLHIVNVGIEYFKQADISVTLDQSAPLVVGVDYQWNTATVIQFLNTANTPGGFVPNGVEVRLRRETENEEMLNIFDGGAPFSRVALDEDFQQLLFLSQEFSEGLGIQALGDDLDMGGFRVINMGNPVNPQDGATKDYVDDLSQFTLRTPDAVSAIGDAVARANKVLAFDASGQPVLSVPASGSAAALALDLANQVDPAKGAALIGWYLNATGATGMTQAVKNAQRVSVASFGVTGVGDDTAAMTAAINWQISQRVTFNPTIGGGGGSAIVNCPVLTIPNNWTVKVQGDLPVWCALISEGRSTIQSLDNAKDIMKGNDSYYVYTADITFLHGKSQLVKQNNNINSGMWLHERVWFEGANDYASQDLNTSGAYPVTSTQPIYNECRWIRCKRGLKTQADHTFVSGGWMQPEGDFFDANTAFIWTGGMLSLNCLMTIPGGTFPAKSRWIDCHGAIRCFQTRFGGEGGGLPVVYWFTTPVRYLTGDPQSGEAGASFTQCTLYGGDGSRADQGIIVFQGEMPMVARFTDCTGPITAPWVKNDPANGGIPDIAVYIAALKTLWSGDDMYGEIKYTIHGDKSKFNSATVKWPAALDTYVYTDAGRNVLRRAKIQQAAPLTPASGATTILNLSSTIYDPYTLKTSPGGNGSIQAPPFAKYATLRGFVEMDSHTSNNLIYNLRLYKGGVAIPDGTINYVHSATGIPRMEVTWDGPVLPGDTLDLRVFHVSGATRTLTTATLSALFE
jgi:hypothetical protein